MNRYLLLCVASAVIGALVAGYWHGDQDAGLATIGEAHAQSPVAALPRRSFGSANDQPQLTPEELANIHVYDEANSSVVNVTTSTVQYDRFFMLPIPGKGSGSGSVLDQRGHILTNYHVVEDAEKIEVTLANGTTYPAEMVGYDVDTDIAVIEIDAPAEQLHPILLGSSDSLRVGQKAYAIGNPFGMDRSLSTGIISSLNRTPPDGDKRRALHSLIQTDAAMNPGNSGGPLLNSAAEMIGMNVAIATKTGQNAGVGFAIPVNRIRRVVPELIRHGKVLRPDHGIDAVQETNLGLRIARVVDGGPAERAGLRGIRVVVREQVRGGFSFRRQGLDYDHADIIQAINGEPIHTYNEFADAIERYKPGDAVTFTILREGRQQQVRVKLGAA